MASPLQLTPSLVCVVILVLCNLANVQADTETFDDILMEDLEPEARLSFTTGNGSLASLIPD